MEILIMKVLANYIFFGVPVSCGSTPHAALFSERFVFNEGAKTTMGAVVPEGVNCHTHARPKAVKVTSQLDLLSFNSLLLKNNLADQSLWQWFKVLSLLRAVKSISRGVVEVTLSGDVYLNTNGPEAEFDLLGRKRKALLNSMIFFSIYYQPRVAFLEKVNHTVKLSLLPLLQLGLLLQFSLALSYNKKSPFYLAPIAFCVAFFYILARVAFVATQSIVDPLQLYSSVKMNSAGNVFCCHAALILPLVLNIMLLRALPDLPRYAFLLYGSQALLMQCERRYHMCLRDSFFELFTKQMFVSSNDKFEYSTELSSDESGCDTDYGVDAPRI